MKKPVLLQLKGIHQFFGHVHSVRGVNLEVRRGEVIALLGDNGAGKSTLIKIISGVQQPSQGEIFWNGDSMIIKNVNHARDMGIETVYQDRAIVPDLTVAQNIFLNREPQKQFGFLRYVDHQKMRDETKRLARELDLNIATPDQEARFCSGGELQGIAIARAMLFRSSLVILDEPTTALAVSGVKKVLGFIDKLRSQGTSVLFVSHNLKEAYEVSDRFVMMRQGIVVKSCQKSETSVKDISDIIQNKKIA